MEGLAEAKFDFKAKTKDELELRKVRYNLLLVGNKL